MNIFAKLGHATAKMQKKAFGAMEFGNLDPFNSYGGSMYDQPSAPSGFIAPPGMPGSSTANVETSKGQDLYGDNGAGWNALNLIPSGVGNVLNWGIDAGRHLTGNGPSMEELNKIVNLDPANTQGSPAAKYQITPEDSYLGAGKKMIGALGWGVGNPVALGRMELQKLDEAASRPPSDPKATNQYVAMKNRFKQLGTTTSGYAAAAKSNIGSAVGGVKNTVSNAYDQIANKPRGQAFKPGWNNATPSVPKPAAPTTVPGQNPKTVPGAAKPLYRA